MSVEKPFSDYDPFAAVYNRHWGSHFLPLIMPVLENQVFRQLPEGASILDLCCGTGQLAGILSEYGYRVTGLDGSPEMLAYARKNAPDIEFINDDARTFNLPARFQAAISAFDSLNHILELEELQSAITNVYESLKPGGIFLFDLNMEAGYKSGWSDESSIIEEDMVYIIRQSFNAEVRKAKFYATLFVLDEVWKRSDFTLIQQCYTKEEVVSSLESTGFIEIRACACDINHELTELTAETERGFFISKKPL